MNLSNVPSQRRWLLAMPLELVVVASVSLGGWSNTVLAPVEK